MGLGWGLGGEGEGWFEGILFVSKIYKKKK